ncbi:MAG TPA: aspartate kinase, partial [Bacillota bacterium]|nr:aspartate kinase [Bacillota bacterium]
MNVVKFGGSSLADAAQIQKVGNIIKTNQDRKFVVVSAPGKRDDYDEKVTDLLIKLGEAYIKDLAYEHLYERI